jgi:hypothetical protein
LQEEELTINVRKKKKTEISYEEALLQILRPKKFDDTDVDEDKCFLLTLLPSFRQFNDEQKLQVRTEILEIMLHVKLQTNFDKYSCFLPSVSNANSFHPIPYYFATNPVNAQPVTYMQNL